MAVHKGWIGVDLDATLAHYDGWKGIDHIGEPVAAMVERVKAWVASGQEVRIMTARVWSPRNPQTAQEIARCEEANVASAYIALWCQKHIGVILPVTCEKDFGMIQLWDDRCVRVVPNTGQPCCGGE